MDGGLISGELHTNEPGTTKGGWEEPAAKLGLERVRNGGAESLRDASAKCGRMRRQKGKKIQEGFRCVVNMILFWCFLKRQQKKKCNMVFNYYGMMKDLLFL